MSRAKQIPLTPRANAGRALVDTLHRLPPSANTACRGWTAHHVAAHLAAGAKEVADLAEEHLEGRPARPTRGFEEREAPFRALPHDEVLEALVRTNKRKFAAYAALKERTDASIAFTGTRLTVDQLETHAWSEAVIHRWDLVGDDDLASELLAQPELTAHAVKVLNVMPVLEESARALADRALKAGKQSLRVVLRSPGCADVVFVVSPGSGRLEVTEGPEPAGRGDATVTADPAQRLLTLWGRRSSDRPIGTDGDAAVLTMLDDVFWPHAQRWGALTP